MSNHQYDDRSIILNFQAMSRVKYWYWFSVSLRFMKACCRMKVK